MFDQTFSSKNIEVVFNVENRKGHIDLSRMPQPYKDVVGEVKACRDELKKLRKKKRADWTDEEREHDKQLKEQLPLLLKKKQEVLQEVFTDIESQINDHGFSFQISTYDHDGKQCFQIDKNDWKQFYAMKILQRNLVHLFNVEMLNRHTVVTNLKLLLNTNAPFYIIRTDVSGFFESMPQDRLLRLIERNSLISTKNKGMVKKVLLEYERQKDKARVPAGKGVPRGIGISSPLSEIFMDRIDKQIREREEVVFYARYVDDIFIILSSLGREKDLRSYYSRLVADFASYGLTLQPEGSSKCSLVDKFAKSNGAPVSADLTYLGYHIWITKTKDVSSVFGLSDRRKDKVKSRLDHVFDRYRHVVKVNPAQARRDLIDGLNLVSGNIRLSKAKSGVKVGFYYNNDLLDRDEDFTEIQDYLNAKVLATPANLFGNPADKAKYEKRLNDYIHSVDFKDRWTHHKMFDMSLERIKSIERWL